MKAKNILLGIAAVLTADYLIAQCNKKPKVIVKNKLPFNYNAQTLPPFCIKISAENKDNGLLLKHELTHWEQYRKTGAIIYYLKYGLQKAAYGYDKMPMEIEARKKVGETEYCQNNYTNCVRTGQSKTVQNKNFRS